MSQKHLHDTNLHYLVPLNLKTIRHRSGFFVGNPTLRKTSNPWDFKSHGIFAKKSGIPIPKISGILKNLKDPNNKVMSGLEILVSESSYSSIMNISGIFWDFGTLLEKIPIQGILDFSGFFLRYFMGKNPKSRGFENWDPEKPSQKHLWSDKVPFPNRSVQLWVFLSEIYFDLKNIAAGTGIFRRFLRHKLHF